MTTATQKSPTRKAAELFNKADKLSTILALALADLRKAERTKGCRIYMSTWRRKRDGVCEVCLAGAVMRERFPRVGNPRGIGGVCLSAFPDPLVKKFRALNYLRAGFVAEAATFMDISLPKRPPQERAMSRYEDDRLEFWRDMRKLLADLKKAGL